MTTPRRLALVVIASLLFVASCGDEELDYLDRAAVVICLDPMLSQADHDAFVDRFQGGEFGTVDVEHFIEHAPSKVLTFDWGDVSRAQRATLLEVLGDQPEVGHVGVDTTVINLCS